MRMAVVGHKRWHAQVFMHRVGVQMQTPDDFCLRRLAELPIRVGRLSLLGGLFHLLTSLTEYVDLLRQRFLDHFPPDF